MITFNNILSKFELFATDNLFIQSFSHGSPAGVDLEKLNTYPAMHVTYTGATYDTQSKEYSFDVYILDLPPSEKNTDDQQAQAVSNAEQIAEDIIADIRRGGNIFTFDYYLQVTTAQVSPLVESESNVLSGVLLSMQVEVGYADDACFLPLSGVTPASGSGNPSTSATGVTVREVDGTPSIQATTIVVPNGSLTDEGSGVARLEFSQVAGSQKVFTSGTSNQAEGQQTTILQLPNKSAMDYGTPSTVTGGGTAGVTTSVTGNGVSVTGLSTGNTLTITGTFVFYQDSLQSAQDIVVGFAELQLSGSAFFNDTTATSTLVTAFPPFSYAFREEYTFEIVHTVVTHADVAVFIKAQSILGVCKGNLKNLVITIQQ